MHCKATLLDMPQHQHLLVQHLGGNCDVSTTIEGVVGVMWTPFGYQSSYLPSCI
jgi:hypothetical protein